MKYSCASNDRPPPEPLDLPDWSGRTTAQLAWLLRRHLPSVNATPSRWPRWCSGCRPSVGRLARWSSCSIDGSKVALPLARIFQSATTKVRHGEPRPHGGHRVSASKPVNRSPLPRPTGSVRSAPTGRDIPAQGKPRVREGRRPGSDAAMNGPEPQRGEPNRNRVRRLRNPTALAAPTGLAGLR